MKRSAKRTTDVIFLVVVVDKIKNDVDLAVVDMDVDVDVDVEVNDFPFERQQRICIR